MLVLVGQIEHAEPLPRDVEPMNPHEVVKDPPGSRVPNPSPFLVWEGRSVLLEGLAAAVFEGAETSKQTVMTISRAMIRSGFLREREEATNCGAFRQRNPRSAWACPWYPSSTAWDDNRSSSSSFVARIKQLCGSTRARRSVSRDARAPAIG
jgi:hypothetical protein